MDISEKSSMQASRFEMLDNLKTQSPSSNQFSSLREQYAEKPITMHRTYPARKPMNWPRVIRQAYALIWSGKYSRVIIKAPRGGGKSKLLGTLGFDEWFLRRRNVVNMGGSLVQAEIVYGYFSDYCDIHASVMTHVAGDVKIGETEATEGHKFSCVTASPKQVRGKHPDVLMSDETCETSDELIDSALPMVNDSEHPLVIMASTFHKIFGRFAETWDNAVERGYLRIQWDIFDVCKVFPADIWENGVTRDGRRIASIQGIEKLKAFANGRTGDPYGWVSVESVIQAWREKPSNNWFEVEYLGTRPSTAGLVLNPEDVDSAVFDSDADSRYNFIQGATDVIGIDWGFSSMTAVTEWMLHLDQVVVMLDNVNYHQDPSETIIKDVVEKVRKRGIRFIYADSAGKFENVALQNALIKEKLPCAVIEVVFSKEKDGMVGNLRAHFERRKVKIPKKFLDAFFQFKNYRYQEGTDKPVKKNDHIPDSTMCAWQHFKLGQGASHMPKQEEVAKGSEKPFTSGFTKKTF